MITLTEAIHNGFVRALANAEHLQVIRPRPVIQSAKNLLKQKGWSYRAAAPVLSVTYQHLSEVLNGKRPAARLLAAIKRLPKRSQL